MRGKAEAIVESARELIYEAEACTVEAFAARQEAAMLAHMADEAQDMSVQLQRSAEEAVKVARRAIARLKGKEEEVSIADLHQVKKLHCVDTRAIILVHLPNYVHSYLSMVAGSGHLLPIFCSCALLEWKETHSSFVPRWRLSAY